MTLGYRECVANESSLRRYEITYVPKSGFHYGTDGVLRTMYQASSVIFICTST